MRPGRSSALARKLALMSEAELVGASTAGDRDAYGELIRRHGRFVRDLIRRMGADPALADDLAQDTFIEALRSLSGYRLEAPFPAWIRTIAARTFMRRRRKDARLMLTDAPIAEDMPGPEAAVGSAERLDLDAALKALSPSERMCVALCHGAGLSQDEISDALDVPLGTVKSHVARGLKKLRARLAPEGRAAGQSGRGGPQDE